jgi:hypothetical protein
LRDFYVALLDKGMKAEMARLTLARKIAAIALTLWKKEERFDAEQLKTLPHDDFAPAPSFYTSTRLTRSRCY